MKAVFVLFDSLNRHALSCYNANAPATPAFDRLAARGVTFDNHYAGSLPCMPARRDLLTGRLNFLHRSWGPVEPYDSCFPAYLRDQGVYTHLISDHYHYWEAGGCGYHNQYSSAEFVRGQERDLWKAMVQPPLERFRKTYHKMLNHVPRRAPNMVNREFIREEKDYPVAQCLALATDFLQHNHDSDNWLLQLELFDPHEPFTAPARFRETLPTDYQGATLDWPIYDKLDLSPTEASELRANYSAIVAMCDHYLGVLLDEFDRLELWDDTALILTTDHGFLLGEHEWWGKNRMPALDPVVHIPLLIHHPAMSDAAGQRRRQLTQCLDVSATLLELFSPARSNDLDQAGSSSPWGLPHAEGHSLLPTIDKQQSVRETALFGLFGGAINITDGRYTYFRYPVDDDEPLYEYTLMPVHPASYFTAAEFEGATLTPGFSFTSGYPLLKLNALKNAKRPPMQGGALGDPQTVVYDLQTDAEQKFPIVDSRLEARLVMNMRQMMLDNHAPDELFHRFGLNH